MKAGLPVSNPLVPAPLGGLGPRAVEEVEEYLLGGLRFMHHGLAERRLPSGTAHLVDPLTGEVLVTIVGLRP